MSYRLKIKEFDEVKLKTQNWTDENVAKLVKQKQKEELERILKLPRYLIDKGEFYEKQFISVRDIEKRLKSLEEGKGE